MAVATDKSRSNSREYMAGRNGGRLRRGGPANKGAGRPPSAIRAALAASFDARRDILEELADNPKLSPGDRIKALDLMGKYGVGTKAEHTGVDNSPIALTVTYEDEEHD